jgi:hypothetical protein
LRALLLTLLLTLLLALVVPLLVCGCGSPPARSAMGAAGNDVLEEMALDGLARHGCESLIGRLVPLEEADAKASSGRVWFRECIATRVPGAVRLRVALIGWQWVDARARGFDVREYVYFHASVSGEVTTDVRTVKDEVALALRVVGAPVVTVADVGRVSARPANPAAALLGIAGGLFGYGANALATESMRSRVGALVTEKLRAGAVLSLHEILAPPEARSQGWMSERQELHEGGALFAGPFAADIPSTLRFEVGGADTVLVRPVCSSEAEGAVDAIVAAGAAPQTARPNDVRTLRARGEVRFGRMPCPWVLVSGVGTQAPGSTSTVFTLALAPATPAAGQRPPERIARATLVDFEVAPLDPAGASWDPDGNAPDLSFILETGGRTLRFGPAMPDTLHATVWLESALFVLRPGQAVTLRVLDLDPKRASVLGAITFVEQPVGTALITPAQLDAAEPQRIELRNGDRVIGWARLLFESGDPE